MKLIVPDVVIGATGEKTLRQYRYSSVVSPADNMAAEFTLAVTNRRLIQHAETGSSKKSTLIHNEIYIENIGGFSFYRGKKKTGDRMFLKLFLPFLLFAGAAALIFWQYAPIFAFLKGIISALQDTLAVKIILTAVPMLIYAIILAVILAKSKVYIINMIIYGKDMKALNMFSESEHLLDTENYILIPHLNETKVMISELSSIILDIQKFGPDEVLRYIDPEEVEK